MSDLLKVIDAARLPSSNPDNLPVLWVPPQALTLKRITTLYKKRKMSWSFHYSDGSVVTVHDPQEANHMANLLLPSGPPRNSKTYFPRSKNKP